MANCFLTRAFQGNHQSTTGSEVAVAHELRHTTRSYKQTEMLPKLEETQPLVCAKIGIDIRDQRYFLGEFQSKINPVLIFRISKRNLLSAVLCYRENRKNRKTLGTQN